MNYEIYREELNRYGVMARNRKIPMIDLLLDDGLIENKSFGNAGFKLEIGGLFSSSDDMWEYGCFSFVSADQEEWYSNSVFSPSFWANYKQIMRGEDASWRLGGFSVLEPEMLCLTYVPAYKTNELAADVILERPDFDYEFTRLNFLGLKRRTEKYRLYYNQGRIALIEEQVGRHHARSIDFRTRDDSVPYEGKAILGRPLIKKLVDI